MKSLRGVRYGYGFLVFWVIFFCVIELSAAETPGSREPKGTPRKQFQFDPDAEIQNEFLGKMRDIDKDLKNEHANFVKNYTMLAPLYDRIQSDWKSGTATPQNVMVNLQKLQSDKEAIQARISELDKKKASLNSAILSHYDQHIPGTLQRSLEDEERQYKADVDEIYLRLGWWLQTHKSGFREKDEMLLRENILRYYRQRGRAEE